MLVPWKKSCDKPKQHIKKQRHHFVNKGPYSQSYGFSGSHACWTIKKAEHRRIDAFELWCWGRLLEGPLDSKEIKLVKPKGNQLWIFVGRTDAEAEAPILWQPDAKSQFIGKDPDAGKDWRWRRRGLQGRWLDGMTNSMDISLSKLRELVITERLGVLQSRGLQRVRHDWETELTDWLTEAWNGK